MAEIRVNRFEHLLRWTFGITEPFAPTLIPDVMPTFPIHDPSESFLQLAREVFVVFTGQTFVPAVTDLAVGDLGPTVGVAGHNSLDILQIVASSGATMTLNILHVAEGSVVGTQFTPLDGRRIGSEIQPQRSNWVMTGQIAGFVPPLEANSWKILLPANTPVIVPFKATLYRSGLRFKGSIINTPMTVSVIGQERVFEPSEDRSKLSSAP